MLKPMLLTALGAASLLSGHSAVATLVGSTTLRT